jgi:dihydrofolate reductase
MINIRLIVAMTPEGVIAVDGKIPWKKPVDLKRFKEKTTGCTLVMGRVTWDSLGRKNLPGRRSVVLSHTIQSDVPSANTIEEALYIARDFKNDIWVIGGGQVYSLALPHVNDLDITHVTDYAPPISSNLTLFQPDLSGFNFAHKYVNPNDSSLIHRLYVRK